jgi:hypothetical protein
MKVSEDHASHVFMTEYYVPGYITVNDYIIKSDTYNRDLNDFALIDEEAGGSERISNSYGIVEVICCGSIITLHPALKNSTGEELCFFF